MKAVNIICVLLVLMVIVVSGCATQETSNKSGETLAIKTGSSFGMCTGYCFTELSIDSENTVFYATGRSSEDRQNYPNITKETKTDNKLWLELKVLVDSSRSKFNSLSDTIGCPDCTDGGAHWIEISEGDKIKRVTYDAGESLSGVEDIVIKIRELLRKSSDSYVPKTS